MNDGEPDRELEEHEQRHHLEHERHGIDGRQEDREREHRDVADPPVLPEPVGGQHAEAHEREDEDRHLEGDPEREQRQRDERQVVARADLLV